MILPPVGLWNAISLPDVALYRKLFDTFKYWQASSSVSISVFEKVSKCFSGVDNVLLFIIKRGYFLQMNAYRSVKSNQKDAQMWMKSKP